MNHHYGISNAQAEKQVLDSFVAFLRDWEAPSEGGNVEIVDRPDKPKDGKGAGGCDAVLDRFGKKCAVEITQVEQLKNMQASMARLTPMKKLIEVFVRAELPGQWVTVAVREDMLPKTFSAIELSNQIIAKLSKIAPDGPAITCEVAGAQVEISRYAMGSGSETQLRMVLMTSRDMESDLRDSVRAAIVNNLKEKLLVEKRTGAITALILDAREISLEESRVANAFAAVWPPIATDDIDEIWIARSFDTTRFVPLKQGTKVYTGDEVSWSWFHANCMSALTWMPKQPGVHPG